MSRWLRAAALVLLAASCGGGGAGRAPNNLEDACAIIRERPNYIRAFRAAERKWGVPVHVQMATIYQESKFISDARTPFRYALGVIPYGYSQALDGTWDEYVEATGKWRADRDDIRDATDFMGWYMAGSRDRLGISLRDARNQYLAYHEGRTGFARGTYNGKSWLMRVAEDVGNRAVVYEVQLANCRQARRW